MAPDAGFEPATTRLKVVRSFLVPGDAGVTQVSATTSWLLWAISNLIVITYLPTELTGLLDRLAAFSFICGKSKFSLLRRDYRTFKLVQLRCFVDRSDCCTYYSHLPGVHGCQSRAAVDLWRYRHQSWVDWMVCPNRQSVFGGGERWLVQTTGRRRQVGPPRRDQAADESRRSSRATLMTT
jgi:hypothetical protein